LIAVCGGTMIKLANRPPIQPNSTAYWSRRATLPEVSRAPLRDTGDDNSTLGIHGDAEIDTRDHTRNEIRRRQRPLLPRSWWRNEVVEALPIPKGRGQSAGIETWDFTHGWGPTPPSLIPTDEDRGRDGLLACHSLDAAAGRAGHCPKLVRRKGKKPEVIVVRPMALRRQGPP
jgi:hypothetical protein